MPQQPPPIGADVSSLMPQVGADVSHLMGGTAPAAATAQPADTGGVSGFAREWWQRANPVTWIDSLIETAKHPVGAAVGMVKADPKFLTQAKEAADKGDYLTAGRKVLSYLSMGFGHELDAQADLMAQGRFAEGAGAMAGTATQFLAPEAAARTAAAAPALRMTPANPAVREAVQFGQRSGIPVDAATATDNMAVRAAQHLSDRSLGGAQIANRANQARAEGLATVGEQLAAKAHPTPVTMEQAGQATADIVRGNVRARAAEADTAYGALRQIEAMNPDAFTVDIKAFQQVLRPIYDRLARESALGIPAMGQKGTALAALDRFVNGATDAPLSLVDAALGDLKSFARTDEPALRSVGQGAVAQAIKTIDAAVQKTAREAGNGALEALLEGRKATTAKYAAADVLETLNAEPVRTATSLTAPKDSAIARLREVAREAPQALPQIGRAVLDGFLEKASEGGAFAHADKLWADWQKLGPETKLMLYRDPAYIKDLDSFFLLAKKTAENANPSGTAHAVAMLAQGSQIFNPLAFIGTVAGTAGLSAFLHSPRGVKLLTQGYRLPPSSAARSAWIERVRQFGATQGTVLATQSGTVQ